jgi:hypothetical protein
MKDAAKDSRFCILMPGCHVRDIADACRSAALGFAWSAHQGWGRRELARWLIGPYAQAVTATRSLRGSGTHRVVEYRPLEEATIADLLVSTHERVIDVLRSAWTWAHDPASACASIDEGLVAGIVDETSDLGYGPVDRPGMLLLDRVRSLFVADYLTRPADYAAFAICDDCNGATFDGGLYHVDCARPRTRTVLRRRVPRELLLPGAPGSSSRRTA